MKRRIIGKYSENTSELADRIDGDGAIDDAFGDADGLVETFYHNIVLDDGDVYT